MFVFCKDSEVNKTGEHVGLDFFCTPAECVPAGVELPVFWVATLEAGGRPLLSPPNQIHCVLTIQDCVMVEQRRLCLLFPDEVLYFLKRAAGWREPPILYSFLHDCLEDEVRVATHAVAPVQALAARLSAVDPAKRTPVQTAMLRRAHYALGVLAQGAPHFAVSAQLQQKLTKMLAKQPPVEGAELPDARMLCPEQTLRLDTATPPGVTKLHRSEDGKVVYAAVVHVSGRPRWGPPRPSVAKALEDRRVMIHSMAQGDALDAQLIEAIGRLAALGDDGAEEKAAAAVSAAADDDLFD